jgi:hypothetical protein
MLTIVAKQCLLAIPYVGQNTIVGLQYWCIIVVAILLALQHDEFDSIDHTSFIPGLFEITREPVDCLVLHIMGKMDKCYVTFQLCGQRPSRLMSSSAPPCLHAFDLVPGGFLFPCMDELQSLPADGVYKMTVDYAKFLEDIQQVCLQVLPPQDFFKVGCHIFQKTYYVFGIFGNAHDGDLHRCARLCQTPDSKAFNEILQDCIKPLPNLPSQANTRKHSLQVVS